MRCRTTVWALVLSASAELVACGDSLSSLPAVQDRAREVYRMDLVPDFGRRGETVLVVVARYDQELEQLLSETIGWPTEISFGEGTFIKSFGTGPEERLQIEVFISPLAQEGERRPTLVFSLGKRLVEARGRFWVLPSLSSSPGIHLRADCQPN